MKHQSRRLSSSLEKRLSGYSIAASATGVGLLALANPADAKVVYTPVHQLIAYGTSYQLDLNHDGVVDFAIQNRLSQCNTDFCSKKLLVNPALPSNGIVGRPYSTLAYAFPAGIRIGPLKHLEASYASMVRLIAGGTGDYFGYWLNVKRRYLGLAFKFDGKIHYGWARLNVSVPNYSVFATLTGYAYESVPNKPIITGKTRGPDVVTVEAASLGHLAHGAKAIPAWRVKSVTTTDR